MIGRGGAGGGAVAASILTVYRDGVSYSLTPSEHKNYQIINKVSYDVFL